MRRIVLLLILGWAPLGCASGLSDHLTLDISPDFSADEQADVAAGVLSWSAADPGIPVAVTVGPCSVGDVCIRRAPLPGALAGQTADGVMTLDADKIERYGASLAQQAAHETGHALGLPHSVTGTLMCAFVQCQALAPTPADVAAWRAIHP